MAGISQRDSSPHRSINGTHGIPASEGLELPWCEEGWKRNGSRPMAAGTRGEEMQRSAARDNLSAVDWPLDKTLGEGLSTLSAGMGQ